MKRMLTIFTAALGIASFSAMAGGMQSTGAPIGDEGKAHTFDELDLNNNGELEEMEVVHADDDQDYFGGVEFDELDSNDDSVVSRDEWMSYIEEEKS